MEKVPAAFTKCTACHISRYCNYIEILIQEIRITVYAHIWTPPPSPSTISVVRLYLYGTYPKNQTGRWLSQHDILTKIQIVHMKTLQCWLSRGSEYGHKTQCSFFIYGTASHSTYFYLLLFIILYLITVLFLFITTKLTMSPQGMPQYVECFAETRSNLPMQRNFPAKCWRAPPSRPPISGWHKKFTETGSVIPQKGSWDATQHQASQSPTSWCYDDSLSLRHGT